MEISEIINLQRYPLDRLHSTEGINLVDSCRLQLNQSGSCLLPGFFSASAIETSRADGLDKQDLVCN